MWTEGKFRLYQLLERTNPTRTQQREREREKERERELEARRDRITGRKTKNKRPHTIEDEGKVTREKNA